MHRVARRVHPDGKEDAALLGFVIVAEYAVALFDEAIYVLRDVVPGFLLAGGEETAVLFGLAAPAHASASVEHADAAARDHDVELALLYVVTDVRRHDDKLLALDGVGVEVALCAVSVFDILALAGKGELVALAAGAAVRCRDSREGERDIVTSVNGERNLACAGHHRAAVADASGTPVGAFGLALVCALSGMVGGIRAVGLAAVPVA